MGTEQTLRNSDGDIWTVEHSEHAQLSHIDGFLMTYGSQSCIALRKGLRREEKARARAHLLQILADTPLGTCRTVLWPLDGASLQR